MKCEGHVYPRGGPQLAGGFPCQNRAKYDMRLGSDVAHLCGVHRREWLRYGWSDVTEQEVASDDA